MFQPDNSLPTVPLRPAPWDLKGQGWIVAMKLPDGSPARHAFMPPGCSGTERSGLSILMFVD